MTNLEQLRVKWGWGWWWQGVYFCFNISLQLRLSDFTAARGGVCELQLVPKKINNQEGPVTHIINGSLLTGQPGWRQVQGPG